jgi:WD40 repeat protein
MSDSETLLAKYQPAHIATFSAEPQVFGARFSPCGKFLVAGSFLGQIRRWDANIEIPPVDPKAKNKKQKPVTEVKELPELKAHGGWVQALAFSPQADRLLTGDSWGKLCCWAYAEDNPQPKWTVDEAHDGWIQALDVSPDSTLVATVGIDKKVRIWQTADGKKLHELDGHIDAVLCAKFHPNGKFLLTGGLRGVVKQWDVATGKHFRDIDATQLYTYRRLQNTGGVRVIAFDRDGKTLACGGTEPKTQGNVTGTPTLLLFDFETGKVTETMTFGGTTDVFVSDVCLHEEGFVMVSTSGTPGVGKFVFQRRGETKPFYTGKTMRNVHALSLSPDGKRIAITGTNNGSNGNGRRLNKDGSYPGNNSPVHVFELRGTAEA